MAVGINKGPNGQILYIPDGIATCMPGDRCSNIIDTYITDTTHSTEK